MNIDRLKNWFLQNQRILPWRENRSPYAVWVSEMMLQQTQVSVVIPYFHNWMAKFPTIRSLAESSIDDVFKIWEGLGYYSRARYLHAGAQYLLEHHQGEFPADLALLSQIKGLGPYTKGAIASFAFQQRLAAVDGNVIRVLARFYGIQEDIAKQKTVASLRQIAQELLPQKESWVINEALIELGAVVCMRQPKCQTCPLKKDCIAYQQGKVNEIPYKSTKVKIEPLYRAVAVIHHQNYLLVKKVEKGEIMSGLHEFPYIETDVEGLSENLLQRRIGKQFSCNITWKRDLEQVKHSFTRYRVLLTPREYIADLMFAVAAPYKWVSWQEVRELAFSSGHRQILKQLDY